MVGSAENNPEISVLAIEMSSRSENAMFKAEAALKAAEAAWSVAEKTEREAWAIVHYFEKKWDDEHPDKKGYWFDDRNWRKAEKMAMKKYYAEREMKKRIVEAKTLCALKHRQWQDFLVRDERRIKHCPCGERDNSAMVQCDECHNWVHLSCARLTEEEAQAAEEYHCAACCLAEVKAYADAFIRHEAGEIDDDGGSVESEE